MSLELVANEDLELTFTLTSADPTDKQPPSGVSIKPINLGPPPTIAPTLSPHCKASGKKVATKEIVITWPGVPCAFTSGGLYSFVGGSGSVSVTAEKVKADGEIVLREGDTGSCSGDHTAIPPGGWILTSGPTPVSCSCDVEVTKAGQTKAKAE